MGPGLTWTWAFNRLAVALLLAVYRVLMAPARVLAALAAQCFTAIDWLSEDSEDFGNPENSEDFGNPENSGKSKK